MALSGQTVDLDGKPVSGARVELLRWPLDTLPAELGYSLPRDPEAVARTTSGAEGRFRFAVEAGVAYGLAASAGDQVAEPIAGLLPGDAHVLTLAPARPCAGHVRESGDAGETTPVANATVTVWVAATPVRRVLLQTAPASRRPERLALRTTTDHAGAFAVRVPASARAVTVTVRTADGFECEQPLDPAADAEVRLEAPRRRARGLVIDKESGQPVVGAWVHFQPLGPVARTGVDGTFVAPAVGRTAFFGVVSARHAPSAFPATPFTATDGARAEPAALLAGCRLSARLVRANGQPLANATVVCCRMPSNSYSNLRDPEWTTTTDGDGRLELRCLTKGELWTGFVAVDGLFVQALGLVPERDVDLGPVPLDTTHRLEGRVVTADGSPVADATVFCNRDVPHPPAERSLPGVPSRTVATDRRGHFVLTGLLPVEYRLAVQSPDSLIREATARAGRGATPLRFTLEPAPRLRGRVVDGDGKPLAGATITTLIGAGSAEVRPIGSQRIPEVVSDARGEFTVVAVVTGRGVMFARLPRGNTFQTGKINVDTSTMTDDALEIRIQ